MATLEHITINEDAGTAHCAICRTGITAPPSFGPVPRADMLAAFFVQHATHTKAGTPNGLTASGKATAAARRQIAQWTEAK